MKVLALLTIIFGLNAFAINERTGGLKQTVVPPQSPIKLWVNNESVLQIFPAQSCLQQVGQASIDMPMIPENQFSISDINIKWDSIDNGLDISLFKVTLKDPSLENGEYNCVIAGEELRACAGYDVNHIPFQLDQTFSLPLKCGEVKFASNSAENNTPKILKGNLRMVAYQTCNDGCANRVTVDTEFKVNVIPHIK